MVCKCDRWVRAQGRADTGLIGVPRIVLCPVTFQIVSASEPPRPQSRPSLGRNLVRTAAKQEALFLPEKGL